MRAGVVRFSGQQQSRGCWDIYMDTTNTTQLHTGEDQVVLYIHVIIEKLSTLTDCN